MRLIKRHSKRPITSANVRGLTLIEGLCVVILISILVYWVIPKVGHGPLTAARPMAARTQLARIVTALGMYKVDMGGYPVGTNNWDALIHQSAATTNWHGPYLESVPQDPWDHPIVYECPGKHVSEGYPYDLYSLGPGPSGGILANWNLGLKP